MYTMFNMSCSLDLGMRVCNMSTLSAQSPLVQHLKQRNNRKPRSHINFKSTYDQIKQNQKTLQKEKRNKHNN